MHNINLKKLYSFLRKSPFGGRLTQSQVDGTNMIIQEFYKVDDDIRKLAYILATAFHETGGRMVAVREGFAKSDKSARHIIRNYKYGKVHEGTGHVYYGRGHVQLTWAQNYRRMGNILNIPLYENPDLALDPQISATILVEGMTRGISGKGDFTGKSLADYFNDNIDDPIGARRIVNGTDKDKLIAGYYNSILDSIKHSINQEEPYYDVDQLGTPDKPNLMKDKTTIGTISAVAGSGVFGVLSSIDSPWAFAAFAVLAIGAFLYFTGRIKIIKDAGA